MARRTSQPTLVEMQSLCWEGEDGVYRALDIDVVPGQGPVFVVETPTFEHITMRPLEVYGLVAHFVARTQPAIAQAEASEVWLGVPQAERDRCEKRARDLAEMSTGDPYGDLRTGQPRDTASASIHRRSWCASSSLTRS